MKEACFACVGHYQLVRGLFPPSQARNPSSPQRPFVRSQYSVLSMLLPLPTAFAIAFPEFHHYSSRRSRFERLECSVKRVNSRWLLSECKG